MRLRPLRRWVLGLVAMVVVFLAISHVIWVVQTADLARALEIVFAVAAETAR